MDRLNINIMLNGEPIEPAAALEILQAAAGKKPRKKRKEPEAGLFEKFWSVVHMKTGRQAAHKAWTQAVIRGADPHHMIEAMKVFATSERAAPKDHTPIHPATWINQGCYDDDQKTWGLPVQVATRSSMATNDERKRQWCEKVRGILIKQLGIDEAREWGFDRIATEWKSRRPENAQ